VWYALGQVAERHEGFQQAEHAPRGIGMAAILAVLFTIPVMGVEQPAPGWPCATSLVYLVLIAVPAAIAVLHHARRTDAAGTWLAITAGGPAFSHLVADFLPRRR
jgi:hypothetical protein